MINILELSELVKCIEQSSIRSLELSNESMRLRLNKGSTSEESTSLQALPTTAILETARKKEAVSNQAVEEPADFDRAEIQEVVSKWVGAFHSNVTLGDQVKVGQVVGHCHVESLTLIHDVTSAINGEIIDMLVEDGQFIDYGQPLFIVKVDPRRTNDV